MQTNHNPGRMSRVALVTGGAQRLGREICLALAARGDTVVVHYRGSEQEAARTRDDCLAAGAAAAFTVQADLAAPHERATLLDAVLRLTGDLHLLVNNASLFEYDNAHTFEPACFEQHLQTNLIAPVELTMALYRHHRLRQSPRPGHVITLLDQKLENLNTDYLSYTLAKLGSGASIRCLAQCCAPFLRVNAVSPGVTMLSGDMSAADFERSQKIAALGQSSTPQDIAMAVLMLDQAGAVTGQTLLVDGGQHLVPRGRDVAFEDKGL
jgi:NAD(P)-dependent dehydrogenase (short-subunit alcohol dehydrogenase family)